MSDRPFVYEDFFSGKEPEGGFRHVCGMRGYNPTIDPICPACSADEADIGGGRACDECGRPISDKENYALDDEDNCLCRECAGGEPR